MKLCSFKIESNSYMHDNFKWITLWFIQMHILLQLKFLSVISFSHILFLKLILQYTLPIKSSHIPEFCRHLTSEGWRGGAHLTFLLFLAADLFLNIHLRIKLPWIPFFPFFSGLWHIEEKWKKLKLKKKRFSFY